MRKLGLKIQWHRQLYFWVLVAMIAGGLLGALYPNLGIHGKFFSDGFLKLIKMLIGPVIFLTVVLGVTASTDQRKIGRTGLKAFLYFETVSNVALLIGLILGNVFKPGSGFVTSPSTLTSPSQNHAVSEITAVASQESISRFFLNLIPKTFVSAFTEGDLLQILLLALLFGFALNRVGAARAQVRDALEGLSSVFTRMVSMVMKLAPLGAGGAIAFTAARYGVQSIGPLIRLIGLFYAACFIFVIGGLGLIAKFAGFNIFSFIRYIREELLTVFATSSSESAMIPLMEKLEKLGCSKSVVGMVIPAGYSFNLDGTNIYITLGILFIAQALGVELSFGKQLLIFLVGIVTSQGASGVTGAGLVALTATLTAVPEIPLAGVALIMGVDRFMSEARALTNFIGNGVATIVISKWEKELDQGQLDRVLS